MINFLPQNHISFQGGLKKNLRKSEHALHEYKSEFPYVYSSTFWTQKITNAKNNQGKEYYGALSRNLRKALEIDRCRGRAHEFLDCDYDLFLTITRNYMKEEKVGNCGECADVLREYLKKDFPDVKVLHMSMNDIQKDHVFCVVGMDKNAKINKPSTWGSKAVVVDAWRNFALSAPNAIREYENFYGFKYDPDGADCIFLEKMYFDEPQDVNLTGGLPL